MGKLKVGATGRAGWAVGGVYSMWRVPDDFNRFDGVKGSEL